MGRQPPGAMFIHLIAATRLGYRAAAARLCENGARVIAASIIVV
jgi:hypothetical protein